MSVEAQTNVQVAAALAGRRIDAVDAEEVRFPSTSIPQVTLALETLLARDPVGRLICSAACGADLLALKVADKLAIPATIILPYAAPRFRKTSVTDRPGNWGTCFDRLVEAAAGRGDLIDLALDPEDPHAYDKVTKQIIAAARESSRRPIAIAVWEASARGDDDATADFLRRAREADFETHEILTV